MSYPSSPSNGQTTTVNGITYVYDATRNLWTKQTAYVSLNAVGLASFDQSNNSYILANAAFAVANGITNKVNSSYNSSNTNAQLIVAAFDKANLAYMSSGATSSVSIIPQSFTGDGACTQFTLTHTPSSIDNLSVNYNGSILLKESYTLSGNVITFSQAPAVDAKFDVVLTDLFSVQSGVTVSGSQYNIQYYDGGNLGSNNSFRYIPANNTIIIGDIVSYGRNVLSDLYSTISTVTTLNNTVSGSGSINGSLTANNLIATSNVTTNAVYVLTDNSLKYNTTGALIGAVRNSNSIAQIYVGNKSSGITASSDLVAYANNGTEVSGFIDVGINNGSYSNSTYSSTGPFEGYLLLSNPTGFTTSGNLVVATDSTGVYNSIEFYPGKFNGVKGQANVTITTQTTSTATDNGTLIIRGGLGVTSNATIQNLSTNSLLSNGLTTMGITSEYVVANTTATGTRTYDCTKTSTFYESSIAANFTADFTNIPEIDGRAYNITVVMQQGATPYYINAVKINGTSIASIKWIAAVTPTVVANRLEMQTFGLMKVNNSWIVSSAVSSFG